MTEDLHKEPENYDALVSELEQVAESPQEAIADKRKIIQGYAQELTIKSTLQSLREWVPETPEELTTVELCLARTKRRIVQYSLVGTCITSTIACKSQIDVIRDRVPLRKGLLIGGAGSILGMLQGIIQSNKANLALFEALGPDYRLGKIVEEERSHWQ